MKKARTVLIAVSAICLCLALIVGGTFALFTDRVKVNNHLKAGDLEIGLKRLLYKARVLDETTGLMKDLPDDTTEVDLTTNASSVFKVNNAVPTASYEATIGIYNEGSVAYDYEVKILWDKNHATDGQKAFASQIKITVTSSSKLTAPVIFMLDQCEAYNIDLGTMLKGEAETFTVKAEFVDHTNNNAAKQVNLEFDVQVYAVQKLTTTN